MNLEEWKEFWAYLVGDMSLIEWMGTNHVGSVGEYLEWIRREWIKYRSEYPSVAVVNAGRKIIQSSGETANESSD